MNDKTLGDNATHRATQSEDCGASEALGEEDKPSWAEIGRWTEIEQAAGKLVERLRLIHDDENYQSVWISASIHGTPYNGPTYEKELKTLARALNPL